MRLGEKRKESLQLRPWNLKICIEKVDAKCWLAEMTLVMTSLPLARVFQRCLHSRSFPLRADWQKSDSSVDGEPQGNWNSKSIDAVFSAPPPEHPGELARRLRPYSLWNLTLAKAKSLIHFQQICLQSIKSGVTIEKYYLWKTVNVFKKHNCNPFQSCSKLSTQAFFCICCVTHTFSLYFEESFYCFAQSGSISHSLNFDKFLSMHSSF